MQAPLPRALLDGRNSIFRSSVDGTRVEALTAAHGQGLIRTDVITQRRDDFAQQFDVNLDQVSEQSVRHTMQFAARSGRR